jgi:hypothetical protein
MFAIDMKLNLPCQKYYDCTQYIEAHRIPEGHEAGGRSFSEATFRSIFLSAVDSDLLVTVLWRIKLDMNLPYV